jgi:TatD DNase family protein
MMDMHCHIDLYSDPQSVINESVAHNLYVLSVTTTPKAWHGTYLLTKGKPRFKTALGLHPQLSHQREHELPLFDSLITQTKYVGEIGLDGSKEFIPFLDTQLKVFRHILHQCQIHEGKVMSIHNRMAVSMVLDELEKYPNSGIPILHWFLGTQKELKRAIDLGCLISIGPAMLNTQRGRQVIKWLPRNKILIETDGPFALVDGRKCRPIDSFLVVNYLSYEWGLPQKNVCDILKNNLKQIVTFLE